MEKTYRVLNSEIEVEGPKDLIDYIDSDVIELPLYTKTPYKYRVTYHHNPSMYDEVTNDLRKQKKEHIRFYGEEYKDRIVDRDVIYLIDDDSIIIRLDKRFIIVGKTEFAKNHVIYLIREAVYEGYILDNDLILHSAAFATGHEQGNVLVGAPGAGKTTLLMESLIQLPGTYISNDLVGIHNGRAMASIIPVRIANGTMTRFNHQKYDDLSEKQTFKLYDFLAEYNMPIDSNVQIRNIIFPKFNIDGSLNIRELDKKQARSILETQVLNLGDPVRPYMWVNEIDMKRIKKRAIMSKVGNLLGNTSYYQVEYGPSLTSDDIKVMKKVMHL